MSRETWVRHRLSIAHKKSRQMLPLQVVLALHLHQYFRPLGEVNARAGKRWKCRNPICRQQAEVSRQFRKA
ncbi:hypothetical protein M2352_000722 [Azospirillum fermentarium]|nr:hypothetical protein [Azospirillum fermentarium]